MLHQKEFVPGDFTLHEGDASPSNGSFSGKPSLDLRSIHNGIRYRFTVEALHGGIFRTTFTSPQHPLPPYPSAHRGAVQELAGDVSTDEHKKTCRIQNGQYRAEVTWADVPSVAVFLGDTPEPIHRDLPFRSYAVDGPGTAHYTSFAKDTLHVGLGEKAAPLDLSGRGFFVAASDTFGYDAHRTDPLYKHIPLLVTVTQRGCAGIFSTSHARGHWAVGSEIDGLWGRFKAYRQAYGGLEEYLLFGATAADVVAAYRRVVGAPMLVPRYMMGYVGGGMKYSMSDDPPACEAIMSFIRGCEEHDIPCSAFQMSSGYTVAEREPKTRNVFTWNRHRFPDPAAFARECHRRGIRLLANVKPYVLANHPAYDGLAESGAFFRDPRTGKAGVARLWSAGGGESGEGSHIDFTSRAGYEWWREGVVALKRVGIDAMWNDNNEYNIANDQWECALETQWEDTAYCFVDKRPAREAWERARDGGDLEAGLGRSIGLWGRAMHTELMARSSLEGTVQENSEERPFVLTRSATPGTMRYAASSWSGDNVTSWEGMRGGNALAINAGFSLLHCYGHDTGGFEGPQPSPELLVRWVQLAVHSPRFAINCFKTSAADNLIGDVIEPWMYPEVTSLVRAAVKRRYELVPYTYSLALRSHCDAAPPLRWTGWGHEADEGVWDPAVRGLDAQYWFGASLLVAGVYEPGAATARVYLPGGASAGAGYLNTNAPHQWLAGGRWHDVAAKWDESIAVLARVGAALPVGRPWPTRAAARELDLRPDDWRGAEIFPPPADWPGPWAEGGDEFADGWLEDDGISPDGLCGACEVEVRYSATAAHVGVVATASVSTEWVPLWLGNGLDVILPVGDERPVMGDVESVGRDARGRSVWRVKVAVDKPAD